jgi:hypothetical protein
LLEIENIEMSAPNEIKNDQLILSMLVPGALRKNEMEFLEVEDIQSIIDVKAPKTQ